MNNQHCADCKHYLRHYTFDERKIFRVYCGHCTLGKTQRKPPYAKACKDYVPGTAPEDAFASKEYLSKKLLEYALSLQLLPEIEDRK